MAQQAPGATKNNKLEQLLEDLGSASNDARLQLHLLALETRQRTGELGTRLEQLERELDRGLHQALSTATERARQLTKVMHASLGTTPASRPSGKRSGQLRVRTIMSENVHGCLQEDSLHRAAQILWDNDCGAVPVTDAEGHLRGMLTDRDICMAAYTKGLPLQDIRVHEVMSQPAQSCSPEDTLERAIALMADGQVRRLPIVDEAQRLVGMVSLADVALHGALLGRREAESLVLGLLGALSKPRRKNGGVAAAE
jgi:CBS domain-containing protein